MKITNQKLLIEQLDKKLDLIKSLETLIIPPKGWINAVRIAINMTLRQYGQKLKISPQSVKELEEREANGSITIKSLKEAGLALNMRLVYGFIPLDGSIEKMIERRAGEIAREIISRTSQSMKLEDQENEEERLRKALELKTKDLIDNIPKYIWD
jgi:predicted DNA-binding mobile mystery protein A